MVGGGNRKDDGLPAISSTNIFAALESRRRKSNKKKSLEREKSSNNKNSNEIHQDVKAGEKKAAAEEEPAAEPAQFWAATQVTVKSWADCDDDDDYYATTAPPPPVVSDDHFSELADTAAKEGLSQEEVKKLSRMCFFHSLLLFLFFVSPEKLVF
jgi:hypothetical protein